MARKKKKIRKKANSSPRLRKEGFKFNPVFFWIVFFAVLIGSAAFYATKNIEKFPFFKIKHIESNTKISDHLAGQIKGQSLLNIDTANIRSQLIRTYPEYKEIYVIKKYPSSLKIEALRRKPLAQIQSGKYYLIDREGVILDDGKSQAWSDLTKIEISAPNRSFRRGERIKDSGLNYSFELIDTIKRNDDLGEDLSVKLINARLPEATYMLIDGIKVIVGQGNFDRKIGLLHKTLQETLKDKLSLVKYIDLRHKKIYIGYKR